MNRADLFPTGLQKSIRSIGFAMGLLVLGFAVGVGSMRGSGAFETYVKNINWGPYDCTKSEIAHDECVALVALYESTRGRWWRDNTDWLTHGTTPQQWAGVQVEGGHVVRITLSNNGLRGALPPELVALERLTELNLNGNQFRGAFPSVLFGLPRLRSLSLGGNYFTGEIPDGIVQIRTLESLDLGNNRFTGTLPPTLNALNALTELHLNGNYLGPEVPTVLSAMPQLQVVNLSKNKFKGLLRDYVRELDSAEGLRELTLSKNFLSGKITDDISALRSLQVLDLSENNLSGELPNALWQLRNLRSLNLDRNALEGAISDRIANLTELESLNLRYNQFSGAVPPLGGLPALRKVELSLNQFSGPLPELSPGQQITSFRMTKNQLTGGVPTAWTEAFGESALVDISNNYLSGNLSQPLAAFAPGTTVLGFHNCFDPVDPAVENTRAPSVVAQQRPSAECLSHNAQ